jgi:hypothetical protein
MTDRDPQERLIGIVGMRKHGLGWNWERNPSRRGTVQDDGWR